MVKTTTHRKGVMEMKCPKCGGNAELSNWGSYTDPDFADFHVECEKCGYHSMGSTDPQKAKEMFEKEMGMYYTNEQWIRHMNTEQLAEFLCNVGFENETIVRKFKSEWAKWLKEKHGESE